MGVFRIEQSSPPRIGIVTSKRVGGAVVRNRTRRRLREICRSQLPLISPGLLIVVVAKSSAAEAPFADLKAEWLLLARRLSIFAGSK